MYNVHVWGLSNENRSQLKNKAQAFYDLAQDTNPTSKTRKDLEEKGFNTNREMQFALHIE